MVAPQRKTILASVQRLVVKVGTAVLATEEGRLDAGMIRALSEQVHALRIRGTTVVLVTSGAIGAGIGQLGLKERPTDLPKLQAAAAVGQCRLMALYDEAFEAHGYPAAQMLLTREDFESRKRYVNARNTLWSLLELGAVPIINENDTVAVDELKFGDNDVISALVSHLLHADLLLLLTNVDGLLRSPDAGGEGSGILSVVESLDEKVFGHATGERSKLGSGGMRSKLEAVRIALEAGHLVAIANGREKDVLLKILAGEEVGTLFLPSGPKMKSWKRWIGFAARAKGHVRVDEGARNALVGRGKSLLASGILAVRGNFQAGDVVFLEDASGRAFARGLSNYSSNDLQALKGLRSDQFHTVLSETAFEEVVHRNNLVILGDL
ncbi:MAG: glutamate 5-kinase [Planctomycetes bacterium]|nr:glutamate 5-kinase [Planctomycetota bacterium]